MFDSVHTLAFIGPGGPEFLVVMLVLLMMFGAKDAPRILRKLNEIISQLRNTADGFKREVMYSDLNAEKTTYTPSASDDEPDHDDDYNDDDECGEEAYYDYGEDDGGDGEEFKEVEEDLVELAADQSLVSDPENIDDEGGDAQKT